MFDIEQRQCCEFVHSFKKILDIALKETGELPASTQEELEKRLAGLPENERAILHDGTEREIPRPQIDDIQKENYSGKKKKHTVKNAVITSMSCYILFLGATVAGSMHDKKIADKQYSIPTGFELWQDTGYQGYKKQGVAIVQPMKKPKGKELTKEQKEENRRISSIRVRVEHAIGSAKRYKVVRNECRLRKDKFVHSVMRTVCGLHNLRLRFRPFDYNV